MLKKKDYTHSLSTRCLFPCFDRALLTVRGEKSIVPIEIIRVNTVIPLFVYVRS
jgi:hypothetical protein